jgi:succinate-semialdehyde dehydrogenase/glutarate-semialdehyde dehydrogenase
MRDRGSEGVRERLDKLKKLQKILEEKRDSIAETMTNEMGKPVTSSREEIQKCASHIEYYSKKAEQFLKDEKFESKFEEAYVVHQPLGTILAVIPWNFPFWLTYKVIIPSLIAGNPIILKSSS